MHRDSLPGKKRYCGLAGSSDALALSRLAVESRPLAVMSANALDAGRLLEEIARIGGGRYYASEDPTNIPQIFAKETVTAGTEAGPRA